MTQTRIAIARQFLTLRLRISCLGCGFTALSIYSCGFDAGVMLGSLAAADAHAPTSK